MKNNGERLHKLLAETREKIEVALVHQGVVILPPLDVHVSARLLALLGIKAQTTVFDPWYNKGVGGEREDYQQYIVKVLKSLEPFSEHLFFWGFPEIIAHFVDKIPETAIAALLGHLVLQEFTLDDSRMALSSNDMPSPVEAGCQDARGELPKRGATSKAQARQAPFHPGTTERNRGAVALRVRRKE